MRLLRSPSLTDAASGCEAIERAMATFQSVRRRMEIKGEADGVLVVEDFAHHPTAIRMTLEAARTRWPGRKIWAAFEPRSNTMRRKIFQDVLAGIAGRGRRGRTSDV